MTVIEFIKALLLIGTLFVVMLFLYSKIIRLLKKKSHQRIVRLTPDQDPKRHPIDMSTYELFIFIKNPEEEFIVRKLNRFIGIENPEEEKKYLETDEETADELKFEYFNNRWNKVLMADYKINKNNIELTNKDTWFIIKIKRASFLAFHSLAWWLDDDSSFFTAPSEVIGFCRHIKNPGNDYVFKIDKGSSEDDFIGSFRTHKNFGIYLPYAGLTESGNISLSRNHEINFYSETSKLPIDFIDNKMIPYEKLERLYRLKEIKTKAPV